MALIPEKTDHLKATKPEWIGSNMSTLAKRILYGILMIVGLGAALVGEGYWAGSNYFPILSSYWWLRGILFGLIAAILAAAGCLEIYKLARDKGFHPPLGLMIIATVLVVMQPFYRAWRPGPYAGSLAGIIFAALLLAGLFQALRYRNQDVLVNLAIACFTIIYLGLGLWFVVSIRLIERDSGWMWAQSGAILLFLATVKSADVGAYLIGRKWGRHKWVPSISPKKTWEGFLGGMAVGVIVALLFSWFSAIIPLWKAVIFGIVVALSGQMGDLLESMLKRDAGSKDSAQLVPEFGGILDMLDSVLVAAPFAWLIILWPALF